MKRFLLLALFSSIFFIPHNYATHIVGGEVNYSCLGNDMYEIELIVYRDCYNGVPYFDDPAYFGIFNAFGVLLDSIAIDFQMVDDTLSPILSSDCLVAPPDVCVHRSIYVDTVNLTSIAGGYTLRYQRCCRNETIVNIINPDDTGATFEVTITEKAMLECNSNAKFKNWPPILICVDVPINFDHSALDVDGDSIVYKLCTPNDGATPGDPYPQPSGQTVPAPVQWNAPFNLSNVLGGIPLAIDSETGLLTGTPNTLGQFVVGICVDEYRDGVLISTTRRDFQYNVGICAITSAAFFAPDILCDSLVVAFDNQSFNADDFFWDFGVPGVDDDTSNVENPVFSFPDTGTYTVTLVVEPGTICEDSFSQEITLLPLTVQPEFEISFGDCGDSLYISVVDQSIDTVYPITNWFWELFQEDILIATSDEQHPTFALFDGDTASLALTVTSADGCMTTYVEHFGYSLVPELSFFADTLIICKGDSQALISDPVNNLEYTWMPATGLDDPSSSNPIASPDSTTLYTVLVSNADSSCQRLFEVLVIVPPPVVVEAPSDTVICAQELILTADAQNASLFIWATDPAFDDVISQDSSVLVTPMGPTMYYVLVRDSFGCPASDSVLITGNAIDILSDSIRLICQGQFATLFVVSVDNTDTLSYLWYPDSLILTPTTNQAVLFNQPDTGYYTVYVDLENQFGCTLTDSIIVVVLDTMDGSDFVFSQQCGNYSVQFENTGFNGPFMIWDFGDTTTTTDVATGANPTYVYPDTGTYTVTLYLVNNLMCMDTIIKEVVVGEPGIIPAIDWSLEACTDTAQLLVWDLSVNTQSSILSQTWISSTGDTLTGDSALFMIAGVDAVFLQLQLLSDDGCMDTIGAFIPLPLINVTIEDTVQTCAGFPVELHPGANPDYTYLWLPSDNLDDNTLANPTATLFADATYTVQIQNSLNADTCTFEQLVEVLVSPIPMVSSSNDTTLCGPGTLTLTASTNSGGMLSWYDDPMLSNQVASGPSFTATVTNSTMYYIQATDDFGCSNLDSVEVSINTFSLNLTGPAQLCIGDTVELSAEILGAVQDYNFEWSGPNITNVLDQDMSSTAVVAPEQTASYQVVAIDSVGCTDTSTFSIGVLTILPPVFAFAEPDTLYGESLVQLEATFSNNYSYQWTPPELLDDPTVFNPTATIGEDIYFEVEVTDENGCTNRAGVPIVVIPTICEEPFIFFPNVFTPNGDGRNDVLYIRGNPILEVYLIIYNRWGEKVFETQDIEIGWDGTYKNKPLKNDVYGYYLRVLCLDGQELEKKGNITLLR